MACQSDGNNPGAPTRGDELDLLSRIVLADHTHSYMGRDGQPRQWTVSGSAQRDVLRAIDDHQHSRYRLDVLAYADATDRYGTVRPGLLTRTGLGETTIRRANIALQVVGVLTTETYRDAGVGGQRRTYAILWQRLFVMAETSSETPPPVTMTAGGTGHHDGGCRSPVPVRTGHHDRSTVYSALDSASSALSVDQGRMSIIDEIYDAYPRHVARAAALTAIAKAIKKVDAAELLAAVRDFTAAKTKTDPKYIPHCATWMNQERWTDDRRDWGPSSQTDQYAGLRDFVADEGGAS